MAQERILPLSNTPIEKLRVTEIKSHFKGWPHKTIIRYPNGLVEEHLNYGSNGVEVRKEKRKPNEAKLLEFYQDAGLNPLSTKQIEQIERNGHAIPD